MVKEFNNLEEIQKYYDEKTNAYVFKEDDKYIDLAVFNFDLNIKSNIYALQLEAHNINACEINACDINAHNINAWDIKANDINALNINARDISAWNIRARCIRARDITALDINSFYIVADNINYFAVCFAYENIVCNSIKGNRKNSEHFVLDGKIEIKNENN